MIIKTLLEHLDPGLVSLRKHVPESLDHRVEDIESPMRTKGHTTGPILYSTMTLTNRARRSTLKITLCISGLGKTLMRGCCKVSEYYTESV